MNMNMYWEKPDEFIHPPPKKKKNNNTQDIKHLFINLHIWDWFAIHYSVMKLPETIQGKQSSSTRGDRLSKQGGMRSIQLRLSFLVNILLEMLKIS